MPIRPGKPWGEAGEPPADAPTALGDAVWPDLLGLPRGLLVVIVALVAAALFYGATKLERTFASWRPVGTP